MTDYAEKGVQGLLRRLFHNVVLIPVLVFGFLLSATAFTWHEINRYHLLQQISDSHEYLEFVTAHLGAHLDVRLVLGELIRQEWLDYRSDEPEDFTAIVKPKLQRFRDIQAINWVDKYGVIRWVNPVTGNENAIGLEIRELPGPNAALSEAVRSGNVQLSQPIFLAQGGRGFVAYIPVFEGDDIQGFINIVFRANDLIENALPSDDRRHYDLHIEDTGEVLYENHTAPHLSESIQKIITVANREWTVSIAPTAKVTETYSLAGANLLLLFGLIFSVVLPLTLFQLLRSNLSLRETQGRLADFADISSDWFWETDSKLRFSYFSGRFEEVTGVPPGQLIGKTRRQVGAPDADPDAYQQMLEKMDLHLPFRDFEHTRIRENGSKAYLSISGRPAFDDRGNFIGYRGVGKDITESKKNQKVVADALMASEAANRAKSEFLATMSHEFRTPLNAIIGFSEMLKEEYFGPLGARNYKEYAGDINGSGRHMLDLVNDILDFSAIEASKRQMEMEVFSFDEILRDSIRNVERQLAEKGLHLKREVPDDLAPMYADKRSIYQIMLNLLTNAVKFTNPGGSITVHAECDDERFTFSVSDTGIGIDASQLDTITEPFAQTHSNAHIAGTGTGLGLTIVKSLVEAHKGTLVIDSVLGEGTSVTISLPNNAAPAGHKDPA